MQPRQQQNRKPIHTLRAGALSVSIWENESTNGVWYSANVNRAYTRDEGKSWEYTDTFGRDDICTAAKLLDLAHTWILKQEAALNRRDTAR